MIDMSSAYVAVFVELVGLSCGPPVARSPLRKKPFRVKRSAVHSAGPQLPLEGTESIVICVERPNASREQATAHGPCGDMELGAHTAHGSAPHCHSRVDFGALSAL